MTRVTPLPRELAKLTRSVGSSVAAPRRSQIFNHVSWSAAARVRSEVDHAEVPASERTLTTTHRPLPQPIPNPTRTIPLMQSFHSTPSTPARSDPSTIDHAFLPDLSGPAVSTEALVGRVPLLPDLSTPSSALFTPEAADEPPLRSEILVMAADPTSVNAVSALTEVEGMGPDGVELSFAHDRGAAAGSGGDGYAGGMLTGLWQGIVDDVLQSGAKGKPAM